MAHERIVRGSVPYSLRGLLAPSSTGSTQLPDTVSSFSLQSFPSWKVCPSFPLSLPQFCLARAVFLCIAVFLSRFAWRCYPLDNKFLGEFSKVPSQTLFSFSSLWLTLLCRIVYAPILFLWQLVNTPRHCSMNEYVYLPVVKQDPSLLFPVDLLHPLSHFSSMLLLPL